MAIDPETPKAESEDFEQRKEKYAKRPKAQGTTNRSAKAKTAKEEWEDLKVGQRENRAEQSQSGPTATRLGGKTETFNVPEAASKMSAEEMAALVTNAISQVGVMFAKGDNEAAMNQLEKMLIEIPLQNYLEVPAVAEKVAEHGTLYFIVGGFAMYFMRVTQIRAKHSAEEKARSVANRMRQTPTIEQPNGKPGQVSQEDIRNFREPINPTDDRVNAQRSWLGGSTNGFDNDFPIDTLIRGTPESVQTAPKDIKTGSVYGSE